MLSKLVSQVVVFGTPLIMVCLFIAFIGLFIYFNRRIDRVVDRVNTLSELVSVLQEIVNTRQSVQPDNTNTNAIIEDKVVHVSVPVSSEKIVVSDDEDDYVSSSSEEEEGINLTIEDEDEPLITITKMEHSPEPEADDEAPVSQEEAPVSQEEAPVSQEAGANVECNDDVCEIKTALEPFLVDDDMISVVSMTSPNVIPEPQLEEICTNAVLKDRFLSTNYRGYKVNQLRDLATELHLINEKEASKLKKGELLTFLDKTYVNLKN
jgi:hypothetical protein